MEISIHCFPWRVLKALSHFSAGAGRTALNGVHLEVYREKLIFVASDGRRLMAMTYFDALIAYSGDDELEERLESDECFGVLVPAVFIKEMTEAKLGSKPENCQLKIEAVEEQGYRLSLWALKRKMEWAVLGEDVTYPAWRSLFVEGDRLSRGAGALNAALMADVAKAWSALGNPKLPAIATYNKHDLSGIYVRFLEDDRLFAYVMPVRVDEELFEFVEVPEWAQCEEAVADFDLAADPNPEPELIDEAPAPEGADDKFDEAKRLIVRQNLASVSLLQRRLRIGYNRACRLMEQLEASGVVGPDRGAKPREILNSTGEDA